jgi:hypothetical protein
MKPLKIVVGLMMLCITTPIWYYLLYAVLVAINADRLLWFLYWIYVPVQFFSAVISVIVDKATDKK